MTTDAAEPATQIGKTQPDDHEQTRLTVYGNYLHASRRWLNWLAIANAGGLVAVGSRLSDQPNGAITHLLIPAAWLFAAGLLFAGALSWLKSHRMEFSTTHMAVAEIEERNSTTYASRLRFYIAVEGVTEAFVAACAAAGLLYPLFGLSLRYAVIGV